MISEKHTAPSDGMAETGIWPDRLIGLRRAVRPGPTLICFGGIHGNEPAGVKALESVFAALHPGPSSLSRGCFAGIRGNLPALAAGVRYLEEDLNRLWTPESIQGILSKNEADKSIEEKELTAIYELIARLLREEQPPFYFIDLHTTSSPTLPFITINDAVINRLFSGQFPVPVILGIEEYLEGPLLSYINELGYVSLGFESGQHQGEKAVENAADFIWLALRFAGLLNDSADPENLQRQIRLREASLGDHCFYEVFHRHALEDASLFRMVQGYRSFQKAQRGTLLAHDRGKPVYMKRNGLLFMPLYQKQGQEGFFLIRRIPEWALRLSARLRKFRLQNTLVWLPGVRWASPGGDRLLINLRVARFFSKPLFHLLGYRSKRRDRTHLVLSNRERAARNEDYRETPWFSRRDLNP